MAVTFTRDPGAETEDFFVFVVSATCEDGTRLPLKRVTVSKSGIAEGVVTLPGTRAAEIAAAEKRIRNFEAAQLALQELDQ